MNLKLTHTKLIIIFLIISVLPFLRSCADVSYGFPTVSIDSHNPFEFSRYIPISFFINIIFAFFAVFLFYKWYNNSKFIKTDYFKYGVFSLLIYHIIYILSFILYIIFDAVPVIAILIWILYPFMYLFVYFNFFEFKATPIYPDEFDFQFRLLYILSIVFYFLLGILIRYIIEKKIILRLVKKFKKDWGFQRK